MKSIFSKLLLSVVLITNFGFSPVVYGMEGSHEFSKQQLIQDFKSPSLLTRSLDWLSSCVNGTRKQEEKEVSAESIEEIQKELYGMHQEGETQDTHERGSIFEEQPGQKKIEEEDESEEETEGESDSDEEEIEGEDDFDFDMQEDVKEDVKKKKTWGRKKIEEEEESEEEVEGESDSDEEDFSDGELEGIYLPKEIYLMIVSFLFTEDSMLPSIINHLVREKLDKIKLTKKKFDIDNTGDVVNVLEETGYRKIIDRQKIKNVLKEIEKNSVRQLKNDIRFLKEKKKESSSNEYMNQFKSLDLRSLAPEEFFQLYGIMMAGEKQIRNTFINKIKDVLPGEYPEEYEERIKIDLEPRNFGDLDVLVIMFPEYKRIKSNQIINESYDVDAYTSTTLIIQLFWHQKHLKKFKLCYEALLENSEIFTILIKNKLPELLHDILKKFGIAAKNIVRSLKLNFMAGQQSLVVWEKIRDILAESDSELLPKKHVEISPCSKYEFPKVTENRKLIEKALDKIIDIYKKLNCDTCNWFVLENEELKIQKTQLKCLFRNIEKLYGHVQNIYPCILHYLIDKQAPAVVVEFVIEIGNIDVNYTTQNLATPIAYFFLKKDIHMAEISNAVPLILIKQGANIYKKSRFEDENGLFMNEHRRSSIVRKSAYDIIKKGYWWKKEYDMLTSHSAFHPEEEEEEEEQVNEEDELIFEEDNMPRMDDSYIRRFARACKRSVGYCLYGATLPVRCLLFTCGDCPIPVKAVSFLMMLVALYLSYVKYQEIAKMASELNSFSPDYQCPSFGNMEQVSFLLDHCPPFLAESINRIIFSELSYGPSPFAESINRMIFSELSPVKRKWLWDRLRKYCLSRDFFMRKTPIEILMKIYEQAHFGGAFEEFNERGF